MSYTYLLDIYKYIDLRIQELEHSMEDEPQDYPGGRIQEGQMDALVELRQFLEKHFTHRLPKAISKSLNQGKAINHQ